MDSQEQIEAIKRFIEIVRENGMNHYDQDLLAQADILRKTAGEGHDTTEQLRELASEYKKRCGIRKTALHVKEKELQNQFPVGTRVKYQATGETGTIKGYHRRGGKSRVLSVVIDCDDGIPRTFSFIYLSMEAIPSGCPVLKSPEQIEMKKAQDNFENGDWAEFKTSWRTVQGEVVGKRRDGKVFLRYDGSRHIHSPLEIKKIPRPEDE